MTSFAHFLIFIWAISLGLNLIYALGDDIDPDEMLCRWIFASLLLSGIYLIGVVAHALWIVA